MNTSLYGGLIEISPDGQPITPDLVLAYRGGTKQGIIHNVQSLTNANALVETAEISFDVYKEVDGTECQLWDDIRDFRLVYIPHLDTSTFNPWYELSVEVDENDCTIKHCQGVHLQEAELGQLTLNGVEINTEDDIARDDYSPTIIYDPKNPEASVLDRILKDKASHYTIVHVDSSIANLQRTFSWDGSSIKDAFDDIANEVECLFVYGEYTNNDGKIHRTISVYDLNDRCMECGERGSFTTKVCPKCGSANINYGYGTDSGIFLSHENFAGDITYSSNKDSVKNCFRLVAGDDLMTATIRNINPSGSQYIWYLSDSVRSDMSKELQDKLNAYDKEYASYSNEKQIDIPSTAISEYNALINKYKLYDDTLVNVKYPIVGYSALTDLYYSALNFYSLLKTTLAPASEHGEKTTAAKELAKLTSGALSPLGIQNGDIASSATVTSAVQNYAKVFIDTSLYRITAKCNVYEAKVWKGTITLTGYADDEDTATSAELTVYVSDATPDFIKCQIEKAMKKNEVDATGTVALFKKSESEFKQALSYYSVDNLNILASIARGCLDILIQQGVADPENELYTSMYLPYYNRSVWIQDELREREAEVLKLRGTRSNPDGVLDYIEKQRQAIANKLDLRTYLGESLWVEFCSFRRDDTYQNDNFISDGLSDTELITQAKEFVKNAEREIIKSATLQHTISCNINNFLLVKEQDVEESPIPIVTLDGIQIVTHDQLYLVKGNATFSPLLVNFEVGNWVHIEIDGVVYKLRLTSYKIDYDNLDKLDVEFSDVTYGLDYMSDTQSILAQAQSMATSYSMVQHQANKGNNANKQIMDMVENGLNLTNKKIVNAADNQNMVVDESGLLMREKNEFGDDYSAEQTKIINHGFYYTNDGWKTVKTGLGKYIYYDPETGTYKEDYGIIAHKIVGNIILGNELGIYNTSGSVKIDQNGMTITADAADTNKDLFTLQRKNEDGSYTKYVYVDDDGNIKINGRHIQMTTSDDLGSYIDKTIKQEAAALVVQLTNEYIGITTDSNGNGGNFADCYTDVLVFSGSTDITKSSDLKWTITVTSGIEGEWDKTLHRYTIKNLTTNMGDVVFDLIYMDKLSVSKKFRIAKLKAGADGGQGIQGIPGRDGVDGTSSYIHIKYSPVENPTDEMLTEVPAAYIGICVDTNLNDPTTASSYTWSRFNGKDGKDGTPGTNGRDGIDSYVHFAYAQSSDGSVNFSVVEYEGATHIGVYTDNVKEDSTDYKKYAWSQIRGEDGTSVTIESTEVVYIPSDNSTTPPDANSMATSDGKILVDHNGNEIATNKWLTTIPEVIEGSYLWTRTTVNYSDGNSTVTYTNAKQGDVGVAGRTYFLEIDTSTVKIDGNNIITPDTIKVRGYYRDGDADREVYPCRFVISKTYSDNRTEEVLSSTGNVAEQSFTIYGESEMPTFYTIEMHKANQTPTDDNMLDIQTIPILVDSSNMLIGARNLLKKSNQLEGCHYYGTDGVYSISEDEVDAKRIIKVKSGTGSNAAKAVYYEVYTDNLVAVELGTKLTVSMNVYSRQSTTINVCLANTNGVMQTTDMQQIQLTSGWNKVYTVLTLEDTEFDLVSDARDNIVTSSGQLISTGSVCITSNVLRITDNMNNNDYYAIDYIQLEKGNRPTDYYPAPEDLTDYTDKITGDMSEELKKIISDVINNVVANRKDFDDLVGEGGRIEEIRKSSVTTQQQVDKVQTDVNTYIVRVDAIDGRIESIEQTTECFSMEDAGLRITRKISSQDPSMQLSMLLSEQKLSFYQGTDEVAYFSNNKLYVTDAEILDRLQLGKFAFIPRSNGNLSFRYLGGQ